MKLKKTPSSGQQMQNKEDVLDHGFLLPDKLVGLKARMRSEGETLLRMYERKKLSDVEASQRVRAFSSYQR